MRVGFVGLGLMGSRMAENILRGGFDLSVYDLNVAAAERLQKKGATIAEDVASLVGAVDVLFTSLPGPVEIEEVVYGAGGVIDNKAEDLAYFDLSTSSRSLSRRIAADFAATGGYMFDAPVSGGISGAETGDLAIWVGGDQAGYREYEDLLKAFGKPVYFGPSGSGNVVKLAHNLLGFMLMESLAEVFSIGVTAGVDPLDLWKALRTGSAGKGSPLDLLVKQFLPGRYDEPAFALRLAHKDALLGTGLARELGVPSRVANLVQEEMTEAMARGFGDRDMRSFLTVQLERVGVEIAVDPERLREALGEV